MSFYYQEHRPQGNMKNCGANYNCLDGTYLKMPFGNHMLTTSINKALKIKI